MLLVIDREHKSYSALHLNRDTMTEIPIKGVTGELAGTITGQLALAHTYGSGGADSCRNTVEAVSKFLYGTEIDHYVSLTMDAVAVLNDLAGGVTVEVMDDFTAVDPTLVKGTNITLMGRQALTYIRARGGLEDSSNLRRMERQRQYLTALREQVEKRRQEQPDFDAKAILSIADYLVSDYTANQMAELNSRLEGYTFREVLDVPGEAVHGTEFMEFYADETTLMETVMGLFYEKQDS